ncbi:hypothetical protein PG994_014488 [Apiospora phragmitis]|uniref:Uncharacterized protein n=1 Tax=Apiospora phragmitis TaxID=2905665 RepID=A0ABR1T626_9PEZI
MDDTEKPTHSLMSPAELEEELLPPILEPTLFLSVLSSPFYHLRYLIPHGRNRVYVATDAKSTRKDAEAEADTLSGKATSPNRKSNNKMATHSVSNM